MRYLWSLAKHHVLVNQNMSKPATAAGTDSTQSLLFYLTLFMLSCWVVWMCKHYLLAENQHNNPAFNTSCGSHSQTQTNVLSRISSNSCWEELSETQSSAALLVMVHRLPSASDRVRGVLIQSAVLKVRLRDQKHALSDVNAHRAFFCSHM